MSHYVYILYSKEVDEYYKGYSTDPWHRLTEHNSGSSRHTRGKGPWELVYTQMYESKKEALIEEQRLKRLNRRSIQAILRAKGIQD